MNPVPHLLRSVLGHSAGSLIYLACQGIVFVLVGRWFGPRALGSLTLAIAVATPIFLLASLQLKQLIAASPNDRYPIRLLISIRLTGAVIASALSVAAVALVFHHSLNTLVVLCISVYKAFESLAELTGSLLQKQLGFGLTSVCTALRGLLTLALFVTLRNVNAESLIAPLAMATASAVGFLVVDLPCFYLLYRSPESAGHNMCCSNRVPEILEIIRRGAPLGLVVLMLSLIPNIPRYIASLAFGDRALGEFGAILFVTSIPAIFVAASVQPILQRQAEHFVAGRLEAYASLTRRFLLIAFFAGFALMIVSVFFGPTVISSLYGETFQNNRTLFVLTSTAAAISLCTTPLGTAVTAAGQHAGQVAVVVLCLVSDAALSITLPPRWGLNGLAASLALTWAICFLGYYILYAKGIIHHGVTIPSHAHPNAVRTNSAIGRRCRAA